MFPEVLRKSGRHSSDRVVYLQVNGPRYETEAEIRAYARLGADVVGMTAASEASLMLEAGISYECLAVVTNLAAGLGLEIEHGAVTDVMTERSAAIFGVIEKAVQLVERRAHVD